MKNQIGDFPTRTTVLFLLLCSFILNYSFAQENGKNEAATKEIIINSKVLNEDRVMTLYLPADYPISENKYPVIYLLDGKAHFEHTKAAINFLTNLTAMPKSIVVAIHNIDRNRDFSHVHDERIPTSGGAANFLNFVTNELTPYIRNNYKASDFSVLIGHSFGGTFTVFSLLEKPDVFDAYIAISPYLHYVDNYLVKEAKSDLKESYGKQKSVYLTVGNEPEYFAALGEFSELVKEKSSNAIKYEYVKMEDENHMSIPYLSVYKGLNFIFSDWRLSKEVFNQGLEKIDEHYKDISAKYGVEIKTSENVINMLGYMYLQKEDTENAIKTFNENVKRYPKSDNVYDSLGEAYEKNNQLDLAEVNYEKACKLGEINNSQVLHIYKKNLKRVKNK